jgi:hypothetical protein
MRDKWTNERLDDFAANVAWRFDSIDRRFDRLERRFDEMSAQMNARFDALQHSILQVGGGLFATFVVGFVGLVVTGA